MSSFIYLFVSLTLILNTSPPAEAMQSQSNNAAAQRYGTIAER
jgi:hypothetical protein